MAWLDALDFDPCDSILTKGGSDCIEPGLTGAIVGGVLVLFGLAILWGAIVGRNDAQAPIFIRICLGWFGLMFAACGGAIAFAQITVGV